MMKQYNKRISPQHLFDLFPLTYLTENERELFCNQTARYSARSGTQLIALGSTDDRALYLLKGKLRLEASDGRRHVIVAATEDGRRPISHLIPHWYNVTSLTAVEYFWVDNYVLDNLLARQNRGGEDVQNLDVNPRLFKHKLFQRIYHDLSEDRLAMPTLPEVLVRIQSVVEEQELEEELMAVVTSDPAICAVVLKIANSAVYRKDGAVESVKDAIAAIGVKQLKNILVNNVTRGLHYSHSPEIIRRVQALWWHSAEVGAIAYALAKLLKTFNPHRALLLGLLHDIGMLPIYYYADRYPELLDKEQSLDELVKLLHGDLGALIFASWKFPEQFVKVSNDADNWYYESHQKHDYSDLIMMAQLHSFIGKGEEKRLLAIPDEHLPTIVELPAYQKLGLAELTPENSMWLLEAAKAKLVELKQQWGLKDGWGNGKWRKLGTG
ncbi:HDOD domain-containing protein [Kaarinaea lacus]